MFWKKKYLQDICGNIQEHLHGISLFQRVEATGNTLLCWCSAVFCIPDPPSPDRRQFCRQESGSRLLSVRPGSSVLPSGGKFRLGKLAAVVLSVLGFCWSCGLAGILKEFSCQTCNFFFFFLLSIPPPLCFLHVNKLLRVRRKAVLFYFIFYSFVDIKVSVVHLSGKETLVQTYLPCWSAQRHGSRESEEPWSEGLVGLGRSDRSLVWICPFGHGFC